MDNNIMDKIRQLYKDPNITVAGLIEDISSLKSGTKAAQKALYNDLLIAVVYDYGNDHADNYLIQGKSMINANNNFFLEILKNHMFELYYFSKGTAYFILIDSKDDLKDFFNGKYNTKDCSITWIYEDYFNRVISDSTLNKYEKLIEEDENRAGLEAINLYLQACNISNACETAGIQVDYGLPENTLGALIYKLKYDVQRHMYSIYADDPDNDFLYFKFSEGIGDIDHLPDKSEIIEVIHKLKKYREMGISIKVYTKQTGIKDYYFESPADLLEQWEAGDKNLPDSDDTVVDFKISGKTFYSYHPNPDFKEIVDIVDKIGIISI